jgi:hypothetical protein
MENNNSFLVLFLAPVREYLEDDSVSGRAVPTGSATVFFKY